MCIQVLDSLGGRFDTCCHGCVPATLLNANVVSLSHGCDLFSLCVRDASSPFGHLATRLATARGDGTVVGPSWHGGQLDSCALN